MCRRNEEQASGTTKVDIGRARWRLDCLRCRVAKILDVDLLGRGTEDGKAVAGDEDCRSGLSTFNICRLNSPSTISGEMNQFISSIIGGRGNQDSTLGGVVREGARGDPWGTQLAQRKQRRRLDVLAEVI